MNLIKKFSYINFLFLLLFTGCSEKTIIVTDYEKPPLNTFKIEYYQKQNDFNISYWVEDDIDGVYIVWEKRDFNDFIKEVKSLKKRYNLLVDEVESYNKDLKTYLENNITKKSTIQTFDGKYGN